MSLFSRSSGKRHYEDNHRGSEYYKREGILGRLFRMLGSFSSSNKKYNKHYSQHSHHNHYSDQKHYKKRYKSSWS